MRRRARARTAAALALPALLAGAAVAYPLDGYERTGIARLHAYDLAREALLARGTLRPGALWPSERVRLRLSGREQLELPAPDPELGAALRRLLGDEAEAYGVALLDLSDPDDARYAEHQGTRVQNPGSVAKILVALAWFQALADRLPEIAAREALLRETEAVADEVIRSDDHVVPLYAVGDERVRKRPLQVGDRANLWTWLDWMLSSSSNAAASVLIQQLLLFDGFGERYPPVEAEAAAWLRDTPRAKLSGRLLALLREPIPRSGLDPNALRQGGFFTAEGKRRVPGGDSAATPRELIRYLVRMEQGRLVDPWSSLEIKRLLYLTDRRIRYASHPALDHAAVYFKSGSLYSCQPEPDFTCRKYHGNVRNFMNSVAVVETDGEPPLHYLVAVLSNVLRKNSAVEHQSLALRIHRLIEARHGIAARRLAPPPDPTGSGDAGG